MATFGPKEIKWRAPEFEYFSKDVSWYWLTGIGAILVAALAVWQKNFLFAVFVIIAESLIIFWGQRQPEIVDFLLNERGLEIGGEKAYSYDIFEGFAARESQIVLKKKSRFSPGLKFSAESAKLSEVKKYLNRHLPEIEYEESLVEHISRILRF